jgi:hypothetical protein
MIPQLMIVQYHQAMLRAEASDERLARGARSMQGGATRRLAFVTRIASIVRSVAGRHSGIATTSDTITAA